MPKDKEGNNFLLLAKTQFANMDRLAGRQAHKLSG